MLRAVFSLTLLASVLLPILSPVCASAQLVSNPQAIPKTGNPPVIFLNGFETDCSSVTFQKEFGVADQILQTNGRVSLFFNDCNVANASTIEALARAFGAWLGGLTYTDGSAVTQVDVVGYSMGGLIVRSYLSGKQEAQGVFTPPATVPIRKAVFLATPNFGTPVAALALGAIPEADELSSGSHFLMDLNTWNQNHDDLRGIDAIAVAGTGGTGLAVSPGFDDGLVAVSSASLEFYASGRTRVLPLCHQAGGGLLSQVGLCAGNANSIARVIDTTSANGRIIVSFLSGTSDWQSIGTTVESLPALVSGTGVEVRARTASDQLIQPSSIVAAPENGASKTLNMSNSEIGWTDLIASGPIVFTVNAGAQSFTQTVNVAAGGARALVLKPGPSIAAVIPSPAVVSPVVVAPRMIVSLYGGSLDASSLTVGGAPMQILYSSPLQINAVMPANVAPGLTTLTITSAAGAQTINLMVEPAYPEVFTIGGDAAAAVDANTGKIVLASNPLNPGDYVELYLTGLGATQNRNGLGYAVLQPVVTIGGQSCPVTYAGAAPGFNGLDQINCIVPSGLPSQTSEPVVVTTVTPNGVRSSATTYVSVF